MRHQYYSSSVNSANPDFAATVTFLPMRDPPTANPYTDANYSSAGSTGSSNTTLGLSNISISSAQATLQRSGTGANMVQKLYYLELVSEL